MVPGPQTSWVMRTSASTQMLSPGRTASRPAWRARIFSVRVIDGMSNGSRGSRRRRQTDIIADGTQRGSTTPTEGLVVHIRSFKMSDEDAVIALWERCGLTRPWNDSRKDIRRKLQAQPDLFLVGEIDGEIAATVMVGYEGHRGWIQYLGVDPKRQRQGLGLAVMAEAERLLREAGCPKINLQVRTSNTNVIEFYKRLGFMPDDVVSLGKRLEHDGPGPA